VARTARARRWDLRKRSLLQSFGSVSEVFGDMTKHRKEALFVGAFGGWACSKVLIFLLGILMAVAMPDWWRDLASEHPHTTLFFNTLGSALVLLVLVVTPVAAALVFLFRREALLSAAILGASCFLYVRLFAAGPITTYWAYWQHYTAEAIVQHAVYYLGPALVVWLLQSSKDSLRGPRGATRPAPPQA